MDHMSCKFDWYHVCERWCGGREENQPKFSMDQPPPVKNENPAIWDLVVADMQERDNVGQKRYGTRLQPNNGRNALKRCLRGSSGPSSLLTSSDL
jgi:hypothetical protein